MSSLRSIARAAVSLLALTPLVSAQEPAAAQWGPWQLLLPIDHPDGSAQIATAHAPEGELARMQVDGAGPDFERAWAGKGGHEVRWFALDPNSKTTTAPSEGHIKFAEHFPEGLVSAGLTDNAAAYLYRTVRASEPLSVPLTLGSDDGCRVWLNGELVHEFNGGRGVVATDDKLELKFATGTNHLFVKVANGGGGWGFQMVPEIPLTAEVRQAMQPAINAAIDRGVDYLVKTQQRDGSWGAHIGKYRNGQTALSLYALLKSGVSYEHQAVRRGFEYLRQQPPRMTYSLAVQVLALASTNREQDEEWMEELVEELADWQQGDFAYPTGEKDLSCTQYGALGYWMAARHEIKVPKRAWTDLARSVLKYSNDDGGFTYRPGGASTGSMTVAGLTVIAVCREYFGDTGFPKQWRKPIENAHERGLAWMADNFDVQNNRVAGGSPNNRWKFYYLYGIERLAALLEVNHFGTHDWYWEGAKHLLAIQGEEGSWSHGGTESEPNTAFALLFLNRATATISGPGASNRQGRLYATTGADAAVVLRAKGDTPLSMWLSAISPGVRETHARTGERGEGLYLEAVEYFANGESVGRVEADSSKPWSSQPYAMQHSFAERGDHEVQVKLHFADVPGAEGGRPEPVSSPVLKVRVDERLEDWMLDYTNDNDMSLALPQRKTVSASSRRGGEPNKSHTAGKAYDGFHSTSWICKADDKDPKITVEFNKALRIDRIVLSHAAGAEIHRGLFDRATKVEIDLGGKRDPLIFDVDPDENIKTTLELPRKVKVTDLSIRVLERVDGTKHKGLVGFAEIELRLGEEKQKKR